MTRAVVLYGHPGAGKDTVTAALATLDNRYEHFRQLKHGPGRTAGYRAVTAEHLADLRRRPGDVLWVHERYGATYVVDRPHLLAMAKRDAIPVVHLGQVDAVKAVTSRKATPLCWTVVELWCPRHVAAQRIAKRRTGDTAERLSAYDTTPRLDMADVTIRTDLLVPRDAACLVLHEAPE